jgi:hypothetical protein
MSDVFISYSKEDASHARRIAEKLEASGFTVWWDRRIMPGKTWDEVIGSSLDSAACVVVLWSKISVESRWVREEAERGADRHVLVPAFIEKVEPPFGFGRIQAADLSDWNGDATDPSFAQFCEAISGFAKRVGQSTSKPPTKPDSAGELGLERRQQPTPPPLSPQFFVGRWRVDGLNMGSDLTYFPDGTFSGVMMQNWGAYTNQVNVSGRWAMQVMGADLFRLQLRFANMTSLAGTFRVLDPNHIQNLELNYIATRIV